MSPVTLRCGLPVISAIRSEDMVAAIDSEVDSIGSFWSGVFMDFQSGGRILAGVVTDDSIKFRFEVWAWREMTPQEISFAWQVFHQQRDKRRSLRNKTVQMISNLR